MPSIAITGTPGVGKTTLIELFKQDNYVAQSVVDLAKQHDCLAEFDEQLESWDIDIEKLSSLVNFTNTTDTVIDGHLSHFFNVHAIVVLRCKPSILYDRLSQRNYAEAKINANVEWEMLSGVWSEINELEPCPPTLEIDVTELTAEAAYESIKDWIISDFKDNFDNKSRAKIDWLEQL